jgi:hypothetical protein
MSDGPDANERSSEFPICWENEAPMPSFPFTPLRQRNTRFRSETGSRLYDWREWTYVGQRRHVAVAKKRDDSIDVFGRAGAVQIE